MRQINLTYSQADSCFYEALRINNGQTHEWSTAKEGNALIDPSRTYMNTQLIPIHPSLNPNDYNKHNRGMGIASYHKSVTHRAARMNGQNNQQSKAVGCIITLPRDYLDIDFGFSEDEFIAIEKMMESNNHHKLNEDKSDSLNSAHDKIQHHQWTDEEQQKINEFFTAALKSWQKNAGIRDEDMLYAIVHYDESFPHLHIMALPTLVKENGDITFSTSKFSNRTTHYFDRMHDNVIRLMAEYGIDGSGLINGSTKGQGFIPADFNQEERAKAESLKAENIILSEINNKKRKEESELASEISRLQGVLLDEKNTKKLVQTKGIMSLAQGGTISVEISYELAQSLRKSQLTKETLAARESIIEEKEKQLSMQISELKYRANRFDLQVQNEVKKQLPLEIKRKENALNTKEVELVRKENSLQKRIKLLDHIEHAIINMRETLSNVLDLLILHFCKDDDQKNYLRSIAIDVLDKYLRTEELNELRLSIDDDEQSVDYDEFF